MGTGVMFDNSVLEHLDALDQAEKVGLREAFRSSRLYVDLTTELVEEASGLLGRDPELLFRVARELLALWSGRTMFDLVSIVRSELEGRVRVHLPESMTVKIGRWLRDLSNGRRFRDADRLLRGVRAQKDSQLVTFKKMQDFHSAHRTAWEQQHGKRLPRPQLFEDFEPWWNEARVTLLIPGCVRWLSDPEPERRARDIVSCPERYPYTAAWLRTLGARFFLLSREEKVHLGDGHDCTQVGSMVDLDWLVTEDRRVHRIFGWVWQGTKKRVLRFHDFVREVLGQPVAGPS